MECLNRTYLPSKLLLPVASSMASRLVADASSLPTPPGCFAMDEGPGRSWAQTRRPAHRLYRCQPSAWGEPFRSGPVPRNRSTGAVGLPPGSGSAATRHPDGRAALRWAAAQEGISRGSATPTVRCSRRQPAAVHRPTVRCFFLFPVDLFFPFPVSRRHSFFLWWKAGGTPTPTHLEPGTVWSFRWTDLD